MQFQTLLSDSRIDAARAFLHAHDAEVVKEQIHLTGIEAPTGEEGERAAYVARRFRELGLAAVRTDEVGNVTGWLGADRERPHPDPLPEGEEERQGPVVVAAHLDTVFPRGTATKVRRQGGRLLAPGITDNARGLAAMLAVARTLTEVGIRPLAPIVFAATVGEEGVGDLRGVKHLFRDGSQFRNASAFITIDGAGLNRIVHRAIGACRLRVTISGIGGHSWGDRGIPNPIHALGAAIERLRSLRPQRDGEFGVNVGRLGGGTSINSVPSDAWLELDLRSDDPEILAELEAASRAILDDAVRGEKEAATRASPLAVRIEEIGKRPSGVTPAHADLIKAAVEATRHLGGDPELAGSSTDANVPIALGIPSVALGGGGVGGGVHTTGEWFQNDAAKVGVERALLVLLAVAGCADQPGEASTTE